MGKLSYTTTQIDLGLRKSLTPYAISLQLDLPATTTCTLADTWYDVDGDFSDGSSNGFTYVATGGIFTYTGSEDCFFIFIGDADLDIGSSASTITYGLFADTGSGYTEQCAAGIQPDRCVWLCTGAGDDSTRPDAGHPVTG